MENALDGTPNTRLNSPGTTVSPAYLNHLETTPASREKPALLFVGAYPRNGDIERYVSGDLAMHLRKVGWSVRLTSRAQSGVARLLDILKTIFRARRTYQLACVDVFSGRAFVWAEWACAALRLVRKPYLLTLHGGRLPEFATRHPGRVRSVLNSARAVTSPSAYLASRLSATSQGIEIIPNGLDLARYLYAAPAAPLRHLVWLRAFHRIYNPVLAVRMFQELIRHNSDLDLLMIGPDKGDGALQATKAAVQEARVVERVRFLGAVPKVEVPQILAATQIFVSTTDFDNTPVSVLEAMASGLPVVTTNVGGIPFLLHHERDALLVAPGDASSMAREVGRLINEPALAAGLSEAARQKVQAFGWEAVVPKWEDLISRVTKVRS